MLRPMTRPADSDWDCGGTVERRGRRQRDNPRKINTTLLSIHVCVHEMDVGEAHILHHSLALADL